MLKDVYLRYVRDDGKEFNVDGTRFFVSPDGLKGIDFADWTLYSEELAFKHGSLITGASFKNRVVEVKFYDKKTEDTTREEVRSFFNADNYYRLYINYNGITRWIEGRIEKLEIPTTPNYKYTECTVNLFCENPFFNSSTEEAKYLQESVPMWGFPFIATDDPEYDPVMSVYRFGQYVWLENDGDVDATFSALIGFTGTVVNPTLYQGFREKKFMFKGTFNAGDYLYIDFETGTCTKNDIPCWNIISNDSEMLSIPKGGAYLLSTADDGESLMQSFVRYSEKFAGL